MDYYVVVNHWFFICIFLLDICMKDPSSLKNESLKGQVLSLRNRTAGPDEDGKVLTCDKCGRAITYMFCRDLYLTVIFSGLLQKDLFKGKWCLAKSYFKQNYCHVCHTRFAVLFPHPSCCVRSTVKAIFLPLHGRIPELCKPRFYFSIWSLS